MTMRHLSDEELRETIQRAREITEQSRDLGSPEGGLEEYLKAGEELGIPRGATMQALRERLLISSESFAAGQMVFAPSMDGYWYPATIRETDEHTATVHFVNGGEHTCALSDMRPLSLIPGRKLQADLKFWGWWDGVVISYNPESGKVHVDCDGTKEKVPLSKLRLSRKIAVPPTAAEARVRALSRASLMRCALLAGGAGFAIGLLAQKLLAFLPFF